MTIFPRQLHSYDLALHQKFERVCVIILVRSNLKPPSQEIVQLVGMVALFPENCHDVHNLRNNMPRPLLTCRPTMCRTTPLVRAATR